MGVWSGNGMGPQRLDHAEIRARLAGDVEGWTVDALLDAFAPAWSAARRKADEAKKRRKGEATPPRRRRGTAAYPESGDEP